MMNRLQLKFPAGVALSGPPVACVESGQFSSSQDADSSAQSWFAPLHYEANYAYPLLIWLHGGGDSERQLRRIMPHISLRNYVAVALRGTLEVPRLSGSGIGYRFVQVPDHVCETEDRVLSVVEERSGVSTFAPIAFSSQATSVAARWHFALLPVARRILRE